MEVHQSLENGAWGTPYNHAGFDALDVGRRMGSTRLGPAIGPSSRARLGLPLETNLEVLGPSQGKILPMVCFP